MMPFGFRRHSGGPLTAAACAVAAVLVPGAAAHAQFSQLVVFGDSLSDNGNVYALTGHTVPVSPPYDGGRFTNGPVWAEDLATKLGIPLVDNAFGGAETSTANVDSSLLPSLPGMQTEVNNYLTANPTLSSSALYVLWGGANDYFADVQANPTAVALNPTSFTTTTVNNITGEIGQLAAAGATHFLVLNLANLGALPGTSGTTAAGLFTTLTTLHNAELATAVSNFNAVNPADHVALVDVNTAFNNAISNPGAYGFTNVTQPYVSNQGQTIGTDPIIVGTGPANNYLFWDEIHPTAAGHSLVAAGALAAIAPEPGSLALMLTAAAAIAGGLIIRRRQKAAA